MSGLFVCVFTLLFLVLASCFFVIDYRIWKNQRELDRLINLVDKLEKWQRKL